MARSVADKFQREKTCLFSLHFRWQFLRDFAILLSRLNMTRCRRRRENRRVSFPLQWNEVGRVIKGQGNGVKLYLKSQ